jgi:hypothetical protein
MTLKNTIRTTATLVLALVLGTALYAEIRKLSAPLIVALQNRSAEPVNLREINTKTGALKELACTPLTKKLFRLRPITIPVIPYNRYREAFIAGDPLFPKEALHVTTSRGKFAVWRDETGIMCSLEFTPGRFREDCVPVNLLRAVDTDSDKQKLIRSIALLLTINELGDLSLERQE